MKRLSGIMAVVALAGLLATQAAAETGGESGAAPGPVETVTNQLQPGVETPAIEKVEVPEKVIEEEMKGPETTVDQWREDINRMKEKSDGK